MDSARGDAACVRELFGGCVNGEASLGDIRQSGFFMNGEKISVYQICVGDLHLHVLVILRPCDEAVGAADEDRRATEIAIEHCAHGMVGILIVALNDGGPAAVGRSLANFADRLVGELHCMAGLLVLGWLLWRRRSSKTDAG